MKRLLTRVHPVAPDEKRGHVERQIDDAVLDLDVLLVKDEGRVEEVRVLGSNLVERGRTVLAPALDFNRGDVALDL